MNLILVEADREGITATDLGEKMGMQLLPTAAVVFKDVRVPYSNLIGKEGNGFYHALKFFGESRIMIAGQALGIARLITYKAAWNFDQGRITPSITSMAKLYAARTAVEVADEAIQLLGGYGYLSDFEVERFYRDAKLTEIYEGTKELQKNIIAKSIIGKLGTRQE